MRNEKIRGGGQVDKEKASIGILLSRLPLKLSGWGQKSERIWSPCNPDEIQRHKSLNLIDGVLKVDELIRQKNIELPREWTIYTRIFGAPLTAKTDLMLFFKKYGVGGIPPRKIRGVETDDLVKELKWSFSSERDRDRISMEGPEVVSRLSKRKRLVMLEGVHSSLFHPSGKWWFTGENRNYAMDVELECVSSYAVQEQRAIRRDGNTSKLLRWSLPDAHPTSLTWMFPINGKDLRINTDLWEHHEGLGELVTQLERKGISTAKQMRYLHALIKHGIKMKKSFD